MNFLIKNPLILIAFAIIGYVLYKKFYGNGSDQDAAAPALVPAGSTSSGGVSAAASSSVLRLGSKGVAVKALQKKLGITVDGDFGPQTEAAVKKFQQSHGLTADGIVGQYTQSKLDAMAVNGDAWYGAFQGSITNNASVSYPKV